MDAKSERKTGSQRRLLAATGAGLLAAAIPPLAADSSAAAAQPNLKGDTVLAEPVVRVATFDCARFNPAPGSATAYGEALVVAFALRPWRPNPQIGRWRCRLFDAAPFGVDCFGRGGAPLQVRALRVRLEFAVRGSCATIRFEGPDAGFSPAPGIVAIRLNRSQRVHWRIDTNRDARGQVWSSFFALDLGFDAAPLLR